MQPESVQTTETNPLEYNENIEPEHHLKYHRQLSQSTQPQRQILSRSVDF